MDIRVQHSELLKALELISRVSVKHVTLPVLQCVYIEAKNETLTLQATNIEVGIEISLKANINEPGVIAVPAQTFLQSIQFISQKEVTLRVEEQVLQIETDSTNTSIKLFSADEFPTIRYTEGKSLQIDTTLFSLGLKSVVFAASQTSIKPELGSVFIQQKREHSLTFVATDSFRLMEKTIPQKNLILEQSFMIPYKNAIELSRVCDVVGGTADLVVTENQCGVRFSEGVYFTTRLVSGNFPDYEQIIPKEYISHITLLKDDLLKTFKKTSIFLNKFRQVSLTITQKNLTVASQNAEIGHTTNTISANTEGEELTLSFNQQYIMDPLSHIQDDSIKMSFSGIGRAMVIKGSSDGTFRYLVMPMNK